MMIKLIAIIFAVVFFSAYVFTKYMRYLTKVANNDIPNFIPICPQCGFGDFYATDFMNSEQSNLHICSYCRSLLHISDNGFVEIRADDACSIFPQAISTPLVFYGTDGLNTKSASIVMFEG